MPYIAVPKDLSRIKTKVMLNLTKRQLLCFGSGAAVGLPLFFILKKILNPSVSTLIMVFSMLPFFLFSIYEKNGLPLEILVRNIVLMRFIRSMQRPYVTDNFYASITRHNYLEKEVSAIAKTSRNQKRQYSKHINEAKQRQNFKA
jgi:hypothetical protein